MSVSLSNLSSLHSQKIEYLIQHILKENINNKYLLDNPFPVGSLFQRYSLNYPEKQNDHRWAKHEQEWE